MIYKGIIVSIICLLSLDTKAQTFAEWFSQKKTQKKYLLQQIAALQVYATYLKQGYGIATNGLGNISGYLNSENQLHSAYYSRLQSAAPAVTNNTMVKEILNWQQDILTRTQAIKKISGLSIAENRYLANVCSAVLKDCDAELNTLQQITTDNKMEMSDAERMSCLNKIHTAMEANYKFVSHFSAQVNLVIASRKQETDQTAASKRIYGIN